jgi:hypothetical protein
VPSGAAATAVGGGGGVGKWLIGEGKTRYHSEAEPGSQRWDVGNGRGALAPVLDRMTRKGGGPSGG